MNELTTSVLPRLPLQANKNYNAAIVRFNSWLKDQPVTEDVVREFFRQHTGEYSARTLQLWKVAIKAAVLKASPTHDTRVLAAMRETFRQIKLPKAENKLRLSDVFTKREIKQIISFCDRDTGLFLQALYDTAARISELISVKLSYCKKESKVVRMKITGKGGRERYLTLEVKRFEQIKKYCSGKTYLFERKGGKPFDRRILWRSINKATLEALGRRAHPHQMRHSRITHLLDAGLPLSAVSRFAGHSQQTTTLNYYAHNEMSDEQILKGRL